MPYILAKALIQKMLDLRALFDAFWPLTLFLKQL